MVSPEDDALEDLAYAEAEGAAEQYGEAGDFSEDEADGMDMEGFASAEDEDGYEPDAGEDGFLFAGEDGLEADEAEDSVNQMLGSILGAEDEDEFLGKLARGAVGLIRKAAPVVGKIARSAAPILSMIPHPAAQGAAQVANLLGKLRAEGASTEDALEAAAELAARDPRALPIVAGLAARAVLKGASSRLSPPARRQVAKAMTRATKTLIASGGPTAVRALPRIAASVRRTAAGNGTPLVTQPRVLARTAARLVQNPDALRRLSASLPRGRQLVAMASRGGAGSNWPGVRGDGGGWGGRQASGGTNGWSDGGNGRRTRRINVSGPATITISMGS